MTDDDLDEFCLHWWGSDTDLFSITDAIESGAMSEFARAIIELYSQQENE